MGRGWSILLGYGGDEEWLERIGGIWRIAMIPGGKFEGRRIGVFCEEYGGLLRYLISISDLVF